MKNTLRNEKGVALLTTLMLTVLGFGLVATLLYMVTYAAKTTGLEQEYATALDAAKGGADYLVNMMQNELYSPPGLGGATGPSGSLCMEQKLTQPTTANNLSNWIPPCDNKATLSDPSKTPDLMLTLANHRVSVKIIDTRKTATNFFYTVNVKAESLNRPDQNVTAEISFLYQLEVP